MSNYLFFFQINNVIKNGLIYLFFSQLFFCYSAFSQDDLTQPRIIVLPQTDALSSYGECYPGESDKPTILILHGFMLTHNFQTVKRLAESLHDSGYNVLTPTLTLGINKRKQSMSCEAIHTHSLLDDMKEIEQWVQWLTKKSLATKAEKKIIMIGHSAGSSQIISYIHHYPQTPVKYLIFLSMPNFGDSPNSFERKQDLELAESAKNDNEMKVFSLSYCRKYVTTAKNFISYYNLSKKNLFKYLEQSPIDKTLVLGSEDTRVDKEWNKNLSSTGMNVIIIPGANHFFDSEHEFNLFDVVENILMELK
ncbi:alpha/beta hydrolase [sulfur-oxidizing endosymbiont of Gigantopelta aegis]|uniref:alpha/beta hydrolase n=1 Tax=sulfur-oxidizing endosymbiont of Gigantopelta aegis TaxID=2794934 RepID=UPI001BE4A4C4|nr:alpha/beta fold hydrolase [sulfur-oxidizing endosymbiont of Gigantopelta aegis]